MREGRTWRSPTDTGTWHSQIQRVEEWLPEAGGRGSGEAVLVRDDEKVLEVDSDDGCTSVNVLNPTGLQNHNMWKVVKTVNCTSCIFYHNKKNPDTFLKSIPALESAMVQLPRSECSEGPFNEA